MSKPEQAAWDSLRPVLAEAGLDPRRVENVVGPGHPDVDYAGGHIELKALEAFPARPDTSVKLAEFSGEQAGWLWQRQRAGGRAFLLVRVGTRSATTWYLFNAVGAMQVYNGLTATQWVQRCVLCGSLRSVRTRLIDTLKGPTE